MEVSGQFLALAALPPEKEPTVPLGWEAELGPGAGLDAVAKRRPCPCRESNPGNPAHSLVTILTILKTRHDSFLNYLTTRS